MFVYACAVAWLLNRRGLSLGFTYIAFSSQRYVSEEFVARNCTPLARYIGLADDIGQARLRPADLTKSSKPDCAVHLCYQTESLH